MENAMTTLIRFDDMNDEGLRSHRHLIDTLNRTHPGLCEHQINQIGRALFDAIAIGTWLQVKAADAETLGLTTMHPIDATPEQDQGWLVNFIRWRLWCDRGKCRRCGHIATGDLYTWTEDWAQHWEREARG
jgi:hypothetical protein